MWREPEGLSKSGDAATSIRQWLPDGGVSYVRIHATYTRDGIQRCFRDLIFRFDEIFAFP